MLFGCPLGLSGYTDATVDGRVSDWRRGRDSPARRGVAIVVAWIALLSGCGGPMRADELAPSVDTLSFSAADGELLARDVARNRTKTTFARAHARELGEAVDHEAEKLQDASAEGEVAVRKRAAVDLGGRISEALGQIRTAPGSEEEGRSAEGALTRLGDRAGRLAEGL